MDEYILNGVESLMNRSIISPYAICKLIIILSIVGICSWFFMDNQFNFTLDYLFNGIACLCALFIFHNNYQKIIYVEHRNDRRLDNELRYQWSNMRISVLWMLGITCILYILKAHYCVPAILCEVVWLIYLYLVSVTWIKPDKKNLYTKRIHKKKSHSKIKRRAY